MVLLLRLRRIAMTANDEFRFRAHGSGLTTNGLPAGRQAIDWQYTFSTSQSPASYHPAIQFQKKLLFPFQDV
jgi:hypothetical protein